MKAIRIIIFLLVFASINSYAQDIPYGVNEKAGHYCNVGDAKIYYEVYGEGKPIVLLHGGFGYIDQFNLFMPILSKKYKVIAIAQRGYGKSEIGTIPFSHALCAEDVKAVIQKESQEKAIIIGFSSGANIGYLIAYKYPEIVDKVIAMGGVLHTSEGEKYEGKSLGITFEQYRPDFKKIMPQPERWDQFMENIALLWNEPEFLKLADLNKIDCPVLLLFGDKDGYCKPQAIAEVYNHFPHAQLAIFPNSTHIEVSFRYSKNSNIILQYILIFIENK